ncbi:MAG TPA: glycosyltransferase, partial [Candidatus Paceibacterota bacterium]
TLHESIPHKETPVVYASHAIFVNLTPLGSFDKTILEACASGAVVITANGALRQLLPKALQTDGSVERTALAIETALNLSAEERRAIGERNRQYVEERHALPHLIEKLVTILKSTPDTFLTRLRRYLSQRRQTKLP